MKRKVGYWGALEYLAERSVEPLNVQVFKISKYYNAVLNAWIINMECFCGLINYSQSWAFTSGFDEKELPYKLLSVSEEIKFSRRAYANKLWC